MILKAYNDFNLLFSQVSLVHQLDIPKDFHDLQDYTNTTFSYSPPHHTIFFPETTGHHRIVQASFFLDVINF